MPTHSDNGLDAHRLRMYGPYRLEFCLDTTGFPTPLPDTRPSQTDSQASQAGQTGQTARPDCLARTRTSTVARPASTKARPVPRPGPLHRLGQNPGQYPGQAQYQARPVPVPRPDKVPRPPWYPPPTLPTPVPTLPPGYTTLTHAELAVRHRV